MSIIALLLLFGMLAIGGIMLLAALFSNKRSTPLGYILLVVGFFAALLMIGASVTLWIDTRDESMARSERLAEEAQLQVELQNGTLPNPFGSIPMETINDDSDNQSHIVDLSPSIAASSHVTSRGDKSMISVVGLLILAVLFIGGIVLLVALLSSEKTRPIGYILLASGLVCVMLIVILGFSWTSSSVAVKRSVAQYQSHGEDTRIDQNSMIEEAIDVPDIETQPKPPEPPSDTAPPVADSPSPTTALPTAVKPAWVDRTDFVASDGTYETNVSIGPYQTQLECRSRLDAAMVKATNEYIREFLYQGHRTEHPVRLSPVYIKRAIATGENYTERTSVRSLDGREMVTLHVKLRFSPEVQQVLKQQQKETVLTGKLWYTGFGACLVLTGLLTLFSYLKLDTATKGFYTRRLQFSAGVVILAVMAMGCLLLRGAIVEPLMYGLMPF